MPCIMCCPQYADTPACMSRNRRLHSRRSNSRSVCRRVIPVNKRYGPLSPQVTHICSRDSQTGNIGHIYKRHIMKPPGLRSGVRYKHSDTVLGTYRAAPESVRRPRKASSGPRRLGGLRCPVRPLPVITSLHTTLSRSMMSAAHSEN